MDPIREAHFQQLICRGAVVCLSLIPVVTVERNETARADFTYGSLDIIISALFSLYSALCIFGTVLAVVTWITLLYYHRLRTRPASAVIDGVGVLALVPTPAGAAIVLQKQFRPPVAKVCIEVPAGLIDSGESGSECAVRELHEETGYVGTLIGSGDEDKVLEGKKQGELGVMFNDPGFTNTNLQLIPVAIDPQDPKNKDPKPELEADEFITTFTVLVKDLWTECRKLEAQGYAIDARVGTLAEGVKIASELGLSADSGPYAAVARQCEAMRARENVDTYREENASLG